MQQALNLHFAVVTTFSLPKRAIKEDLVINKEDLVRNKLFHNNEPFQPKNRRVKI